MRFINYRILEISIALALGIIVSVWIDFPEEFLVLLFLNWLYLLYRYHADRNRFLPSMGIPIFVYLLFFQIGYWSHYFHLEIYKSESYNLMEHDERPALWTFTIESIGKSDTTFSRYNIQTYRRGKEKISERVYLTINSGESLPKFQPNDVLLVYGKCKKIEPSPNPYQFNFADHMARNGIYYSMVLKPSDIIKIQKGKGSLAGQAEQLRSYLIDKLEKTPLQSDVKAITQALTLGDRTDIDEGLYDAYAKAGAVHILAISGLHIGIIMVLLNQLFSFLLRFRKGRLLRISLVVFFLWGFALLTGLSPSVVRAVSMFSLFSLGDLSERPTKGINTLSLSFFITLILTPSWLFHLGFQMSYLAVGSILLLQPQFQKIGTFRFWPMQKLWDIFSVSLAAQLAVGPLSLYYFHQFPGLFWLTNWILLPFLALVLMYAFGIIVLSNISSTTFAIFDGYDFMISNMNSLVTWLAQQENFIIKTGSISLSLVIIAYSFIIGFAVSQNHLFRRILLVSLGFLLLINTQSTINTYKSRQQLIWFHSWGESCFVIEAYDEIKVFSSISKSEIRHPLKNYLGLVNKPFVYVDSIPKVFHYNKTTYLVIDSSGVYPKLQNVVVLLRQNPKIHVERMAKDLQPRQVIADGSNYTSVVQKWERSLRNLEVPFRATSEEAFVNKID